MTAVITPQELSALCRRGEPLELIDVRTPAEFRELHVAAARNVPLDRLDPSPGRLLSQVVRDRFAPARSCVPHDHWVRRAGRRRPPGVHPEGAARGGKAAGDECDACHRETSWSYVRPVDHTAVIGTCISCHNGQTATGKPPTHIPTSSDCEACHRTRAWVPTR